MGKLNEIQDEKTQSWGGNSFTTTVKEDTVEFDSAKDKFTFKDAVEVPSLKINGTPITPSEPQVQSDWNQANTSAVDYIKNKPAIPSFANTNTTVTGNNSVAMASSNCTVSGNNSATIGCYNVEANINNMVYVPAMWNQSQTEILKDNGDGVTTFFNKKKIYTKYSIQGGGSITLAFPQNANQTLIIDLKYCVKTAQGSTATATIRQGNTSQDIENLTVDGEWHSIVVEPNIPNTSYTFWTENGIAGDEVSLICETYANTIH